MLFREHYVLAAAAAAALIVTLMLQNSLASNIWGSQRDNNWNFANVAFKMISLMDD